MKIINSFEYIKENMEQARHILRYYDIDYSDDRFQKIIKKTQRDGYTGLITRLVFAENIDVEDTIKLYDEIKDNKLNMAEIQKLSYNQIKKLIEDKKDKKNYEFIFDVDDYKVYLINTYEGALETTSPAWCLKTKSHWDHYTITKGGTQFVAIKKEYVSNSDIKLMVPNKWDGSTYRSNDNKSRYGITVYHRLRVDVFDDNNIQYHRFEPELDKIVKECISYAKNIFGDKVINIEGLDNLIENLSDILENMYGILSFNNIVYTDIDKLIEEFYIEIKERLNLSKEELFKKMTEYKDLILQEDFFVANNGIMDLLINEWLTQELNMSSLDDYDNVLKSDLHPLGGLNIREQEYEDWVIKYNYGYQYTKYGRAAIIQSFGSIENFYKNLKDKFVYYLQNKYDIDKNHTKHFKYEQYKDGWLISANMKDILDYVDDFIKNNGTYYYLSVKIKDDKLYIELYSKE